MATVVVVENKGCLKGLLSSSVFAQCSLIHFLCDWVLCESRTVVLSCWAKADRFVTNFALLSKAYGSIVVLC